MCVRGVCVCDISRTARQLFELFSALALRSADTTPAIAIYRRIMDIVDTIYLACTPVGDMSSACGAVSTAASKFL